MSQIFSSKTKLQARMMKSGKNSEKPCLPPQKKIGQRNVHHFGNELGTHLREQQRPFSEKDRIGSNNTYLDQLASSFRRSMSKEHQLTSEKQTNVTSEDYEPDVQQIYTLEDMTESKETVIEQPIKRICSVDDCKVEPCKSTVTLSNQSIIDSRKCQDASAKLSQLKLTVVDLIDQTIRQLESEKQLGHASTLHPSGDGSKPLHRVQNLKVLKTDSFAQYRTAIRRRLYMEIEQLISRLKDMECLE
ncbi:uncharacterized protein LOC129721529 [Wyeomyia smithii]|uniref:uncharacterized protein LOC129721529 n=1 Tax=Wyeomyia smithii TaxID=174621 RepID=UPI002468020A|nr:uncharacterized protein LOC129721529 [Wyeomyia smithii]